MLIRITTKVNRAVLCPLVMVAFAVLCAPSTQAKRSVILALMSSQDVVPLEGRQGYALVQLDVSGVAPSLELRRLGGNSGRPYTGKKYTVDLSQRDKGLYLAQLPPGTYQITRVNAPFYDLPFRLSTAGDARWRFKVQSGKTSYIGMLRIPEERSRTDVDIVFRNRIAATLDQIEDQFGAVIATAPLITGRAERDDFLSDSRRAGDAP